MTKRNPPLSYEEGRVGDEDISGKIKKRKKEPEPKEKHPLETGEVLRKRLVQHGNKN